MLKKAPVIESRLEQQLKALDSILEKLDARLLKLEKGKEVKKMRSKGEIEIQIFKYLLHRRYKHPESGLWKCVNQSEWDEIEREMRKEMKELEKE